MMAERSRGRVQGRRYAVPAGLAAALFAGVVASEHRVLAGLDATPDPDSDAGFAFPAERIPRGSSSSTGWGVGVGEASSSSIITAPWLSWTG
jgi:hypothetical protein